jgi:hypothetical protein
MDFVTGLLLLRDPATNVPYDAIFNVNYQFTKEAEFILFRYNYTAVQLAHVFND